MGAIGRGQGANMGTYLRKGLADNKRVGVAVGIALILIAGVSLAIQFWPQRRPNLAMAYFTDDDGQTWFRDSLANVAPFDHNGKTAVIAEVYTYDNGNKEFCAYLAKFTPEAQKKLSAAIADAKAKGLPPNSVSLFHEPFFIRTGMMVKLPGRSNPWMSYSDPRASQVFSIRSPDGSAVDEVFVY
jgi:hypothetical protein